MKPAPTLTKARRTAKSNAALLEILEARQLLSASTIRVVSYNIEDDIDGYSTPRPGLTQVLEGIGEEQVQGNAQPIDVLALQETTSNSSIAPLVTALNSFYNGSAVYAESGYQATEEGGDNADGNGPNALIYNTTTLNLVASVGVGTPEGSSNGEYRQVVRYEFQPVGDTGTNGIFYIYVSHMKSGTTSADATARGQEATIIRNNEATLPANASVLYMGDLNSNPPEAEFTEFESAGQGEAYDPENWSTATQFLSEEDTSLEYRDDYQLMTQNVLDDTGTLNYVSGSFHVFANNGSVSKGRSVNGGTDTALNSDLVQDGGTFVSASTVYSDLTTASDHLPVVADYTIATSAAPAPTIGSLSVSPNPTTVGTNVTLTASNVTETGGTVAEVQFYRESNGTGGLQIGSDQLLGTGTQNGSTWTLLTSTNGLPSGSNTYYAVATDTAGSTSPVASTTLTLSSVPAVGSVTINPNPATSGGTISISANNVSDAGSIVNGVTFYLEDNNVPGLQTGTGGDELLGSGTQSGTTWTLSNVSTTGWYSGTFTIYAVAQDNDNQTSIAASGTLTLNAGTPTIGSLSVSPTTVTSGSTIALTANTVSQPGGTVGTVAFYLESNGSSGLQTGSDTFIGDGTQSGTTRTLSNISTAGLVPGTYTYYAVATGTQNVSSSAASTTLTVTAPSQPLADIYILGSTSPNGPFTANVSVTPGETVYYEVVGELGPVGTTNSSGPKSYTIASETAHPGAATIGYDGIQSIAFNLSDSGSFVGSFASDALATNPSTGDNWSAATGTSTGTASGATLENVYGGLPAGVFGGAVSKEAILTGSFLVPSTATAGTSTTISGAPAAGVGAGFIGFNSNPSTGSGATKISVQIGDPYGYFGYSPLTISTSTSASLPAWLASNSQATWNASTHVLDVTGPSTIIADPGSDEPLIVANGAAAQLSIAPTQNDVDIHVGGITLSNGAGIDVASVGAQRSHNDHNVLVIGTSGETSNPTLSIDASSTLNMEDNDLIYHTAASDSTGGEDNLTLMQSLIAVGRDGGAWDGAEVTSSAAENQDNLEGYESVQLAPVLNNDLSTPFNNYQVGNAIEPVSGSDIIVKYTYTGDFNLDGMVNFADSQILNGYYDDGASTGNEWAFGDTNGDGVLNFSDSAIFNAVYGNGTADGLDTVQL